MESTTKTKLSEADYALAREAGLTMATPGTNAQDAAIAEFAQAVRAPLVARIELLGVTAQAAVDLGIRAATAALALPDAQPVMLLHQKDDPYLDPETLRGLAAPIAEDIAKNCGSVPQLVFPYLYLGLREILTLPKTVAALERLSDAEIDAIPWANTGSFTFNVRALARAIEAAIHAKTIQPKS